MTEEMYTAAAYAEPYISSCNVGVNLGWGEPASASTHHMGFNAQLVELALVALTRLGGVVRHEEDLLLCAARQGHGLRRGGRRTLTPQETEDVDGAFDEAIAVPQDAIAVEHPGVVLVE